MKKFRIRNTGSKYDRSLLFIVPQIILCATGSWIGKEKDGGRGESPAAVREGGGGGPAARAADDRRGEESAGALPGRRGAAGRPAGGVARRIRIYQERSASLNTTL